MIHASVFMVVSFDYKRFTTTLSLDARERALLDDVVVCVAVLSFMSVAVHRMRCCGRDASKSGPV